MTKIINMLDHKRLKSAKAMAEHIFALGGPDLQRLPDDGLITVIEALANRGAAIVRLDGAAKEASTAFQKFGDVLQNYYGQGPHGMLTTPGGKDD